ncbi:hypothetical protein PAESOLCIP111_02911 [Paenibacillus solanacearum]|uniref:HAMP domain-containing protein n=1 Tax=Paenibacillus solanacearum TaxID=2048548 RepID=A0A916NQM3_9BACL|nr:histidine kinase [Paenibacillus solanacearum]CAG7627392.1 hypothetical protein PAESOLCIP111_02911 [Paenibacillus solanacearum]
MNWFKRSLLAKLLVGMLISTVIPYTLSNIIAYKTTSDSVKKQVIELNLDQMSLSMENMKRYMQDLNRLSVSFYYDQTLMQYLRTKEASAARTLYITTQVDNLYNTRSEFRAARFMSAWNGQTFMKYNNNQVGTNVHMPPMPIPAREDPEWSKSHRYEVAYVDKEIVLGLHQLLVDYPRRDSLGVLSLYVGMDEINTMLRTGLSEGNDVFLYIQDSLNLLYDSAGGAAMEPDAARKLVEGGAQGSFKGDFNGRSGVFVYRKDHYMELPLTLVKFVPTAAMNESANRTLGRSLMIQIAAIAFVLVTALLLSYFTISPVKRLLRSIARVESGSFRIERPSGRVDELGILEQRFQTMIHNLDDLMNREYRNRLELSHAQLKMLQAQINPHFLYNTLQSIGTLALRHGSEEVSDKIGELGAILRYSMDLRTETVPLKLEIEHIEHYLSLQTGRFKNRLSYTLTCPNEALSIEVPKMILQPLVENSIVHGMEKGRGTGTLHIGVEWNEALVIRVIDNGKGMSQDVMDGIREQYEEDRLHYGKDGGGIGLLNVLKRLRLYYGDRFAWTMESVPYEATEIVLTVDRVAAEKEGSH